MEEVIITTKFKKYENVKDLSADVQSLMKKAFEAREKAYAPYSHFSVGVAILLENGEVVMGSNQENAAYPSGLCAERVAIFYAGANFPDAKIKTIAITAGSKNNPTTSPIPPCGACRQSIAEYEIKQDSPIGIYFTGESGNVLYSESLKNLLPLMFDNKVL